MPRVAKGHIEQLLSGSFGPAAGERSPWGRGDPRPHGSSEGGQVGHLQAAGRELFGEPPGVPAGGLAGALAHHGVRQRPGDGQPPYCLAGDAEPLRELRGGQEVRGGVLGFDRRRGPRCRDEGRGQGPGQCLQELGRDRQVGVVVGVLRVRFRGGFLVQGPCPLGDLGEWSRGPLHARPCREISLIWLAQIVRRTAGHIAAVRRLRILGW